jgi:hypothetical protein
MIIFWGLEFEKICCIRIILDQYSIIFYENASIYVLTDYNWVQSLNLLKMNSFVPSHIIGKK